MSTDLTPTPVTRRPAGLDVPAPPFARLVAVELRKAVDTTTGRWLLAVTGVLVVGALVLASLFQPGDVQPSVHWLLSNALLPVSLLVPVLGVLLLSGEFSTRSVLTTFALVPGRGRVVTAKTAAAVALAVGIALLTGVLALATAGILDLIGTDVSWSVAWQVPLQLLVLQVVYVLVGVGIGLLCQNTPLAVVVYLIVPSLLAPVAFLVPALQDVAPWVDLSAGTMVLTTDAVLTGRQWAQVASVTAIWAALPFALGWLRLQRREIA
jgi:ABC-2 type transport system permease protein